LQLPPDWRRRGAPDLQQPGGDRASRAGLHPEGDRTRGFRRGASGTDERSAAYAGTALGDHAVTSRPSSRAQRRLRPEEARFTSSFTPSRITLSPQPAAVDHHRLPGDETAFLAGEVDCQSGDLFRLAK